MEGYVSLSLTDRIRNPRFVELADRFQSHAILVMYTEAMTQNE